MINIIVLVNNKILISKVERVPSPLGDPDVKLTEPFLINPSDLTLSSWFIDLTEENWFMISSDKILTTFEPSQSLLEKYQSLIK
jgi:hypothetical protein